MSDIPRALFSVGEKVLIIAAISKNIYEGTVKSCIFLSKWTPPNTGNIYLNIWVYKFHEDIEWQCAESQLRKKYKPGDSFDQLIADLKNPSHVAGPVGVEE